MPNINETVQEPLPKQRKLRVMVACVSAVAFSVAAGTLAPEPSKANPLGGKWRNPSYTYFSQLNGYSGYDSPVTSAAAGWTKFGGFTISAVSATSATVSVAVNNYGPTDWLGIGTPGPSHSSGTYTYGSIKINAGWLNRRHFNCLLPDHSTCTYAADTSAKKKCVVVHEMGHVIGLAHTSAGSNKVMNVDHGQGCHVKGLTNPTSYDKNDVAEIY
ncbi:hypothetical protein JK386_10115 [Nocardioides sp. zg-536]|uniref:Matrixin family metalloprotease n=1 Tax=Nocardioides faecalis TaxID=2803858 RepID=A0A939BYE6_9ACTN|nr:hypothetical protein [Nocardioides faecalis]MBM9460258.1 hypothetical protein [Nocardioides faecalis]QVI59956.1 hypothetical protein KG111_06490 [Nocardioides faecalis]